MSPSHPTTERRSTTPAADTWLDLLQAARNDLLSRLTGEIQDPLEGTIALVDRLVAQPPSPTLERATILTRFRQSRTRVLALCGDTRHLPDPESLPDPVSRGPEREPIPLRDILQTVVSRARDERGINLRWQPSTADSRRIEGDRILLPHAIGLLLERASHHASRDQPVCMSTLDLAGHAMARVEALGRALVTPENNAHPPTSSLLAPPDAGHELPDSVPPIARRIFRFFGCTVGAEDLVPPGVRFTVNFRSAHPGVESYARPLSSPISS